MKKETFKKLILPIGAVALTTLPFVSVVSCSNNNNSGGKLENPGDGGGTTPKPTPTKEIINHTSSFNFINESRNDLLKPDLTSSFYSEWKSKILNNQVKWFNDDGSAIIYEANVNIDPNLTVETEVWWKDEYGTSQVDYNRKKQIKDQINLKWEFYKKENNESNKFDDFVIKATTNSPFKCDEDPNLFMMAFPVDKNIMYADVKGTNISNSSLINLEFLCIYSSKNIHNGNFIIDIYTIDSKDFLNHEFKESWNSIKSLFNPIESEDTKLLISGLDNSTMFSTAIRSILNAKGTLTIKPRQN